MLADEPIWALAVGDFGGSNFGDIAAQYNPDGDPQLDFMSGTGSGINAPSLTLSEGRRTTAMIPAFIDGDSELDLVVARTDADRDVSPDSFAVLLSRPPDTGAEFDFEVHSFETGPTPWGLGVADIDEDGHSDVIVASQGEGIDDGMPDMVQVFIGDGNGDFTPQPPIMAGETLGQLATGDLDCDGHVDVVVAASDGVFILKGDGMGLGPSEFLVQPDGVALAVAVGHFNKDDRLDVAVGLADTGEVEIYKTN